MNDVELSIILPTYNGEQYIFETISSILNSKYENFELLIIDDGSKDSTKQVISKFKDSRIKYFYKQNGGIVSSRNFGLECAKGNYITFVDHDDVVNNLYYFDTMSLIKKYKADILISNRFLWYENNTYVDNAINDDLLLDSNGIKKLFTKVLDRNNFISKEIKLNASNTIWNCIFKTSLIKEKNIHFEKYVSYEDDWLFLLNCLKQSKACYLTKKAYYYHRMFNVSESRSSKYIDNFIDKREKLKANIDLMLTDYIDSVKKLKFFDAYDKETIFLELLNVCALNNQKSFYQKKSEINKCLKKYRFKRRKIYKACDFKNYIIIKLLFLKQFWQLYLIYRFKIRYNIKKLRG